MLNNYNPQVVLGLARSVRHYNTEYVQSLETKSRFQIEALQTKIEIKDIVSKSTRIKLTNDLKE